MLMAYRGLSRPCLNKNFRIPMKALPRLFVLGALLATSGCQYFNFGQSSSFSVSQSGNAALIDLKPTRHIHTESPSRSAPVVRINPYLGNADFICGPSGFGQQSHCFARSAGAVAENI
ncbi:hypothetical protein EOA27_20280 [Mesorhizobium sp. M2A.F.Ca.ET.037.01.1.1]|uniref:hypothetical protein n=1 Tax=unclassified Mesorhizobium TaxID=325217 RepID=UPI000F754B2C|nr:MULTISPECIES: hypothetical protein [unclassified Mesorhizobium]RUY04883.1 hypothetical protein EOA25_18055 [Mesorhizobium sp. M2A.F.Ca.ET.040.01.1.1]RVC62928.1 hypothetical protein EN759_26815 [Mesorhizobium sp. M00.F.Ca.ET.038.03.1.1]RVC77670.1 hypothetical protein EN766_11105 [Mesorhizobium sp. M2A.F.Ca.ET.046.02.1.1]AZO33280.1 hypothetical protein EJ072_01185 [Mesorhizobium sp. M2A.F.Ca.ET.046.03.2.1]RUX12268.1 hypothetical protein EOA27_20280 [Mesorhizobium sp. M2A.F.Ca.ET.037.01.1.1]